jgi:hypothetical protein
LGEARRSGRPDVRTLWTREIGRDLDENGLVKRCFYKDTGETVADDDGPFTHQYRILFDWLEQREAEQEALTGK